MPISLMPSNQLLADLLGRLSVTAKPVMIDFDEVQAWPSSAFEGLVKAKLLLKDVQAQSLECMGCENQCCMPVVFTEDAQRAFIVCDHPDQQEYMGRIAVKLPRLQQWQLSAKSVAAVIARLLGADAKPVYLNESASYQLGMLQSSKGRRPAVLSVQPLSLAINQQSIAVNELLYFDGGVLLIDQLKIDDILSAKRASTGKVYTSNTTKREARKLATQAMYKDWQDEYQQLKQKHPKKPDTWYSERIAKMAIAKDRDSETIRKIMKM